MLLRQPAKGNVRAIIAIHGHRESPIDASGIEHRLILQIDDAESNHGGDPIDSARIRLRRREAAEFGLELRPPTMEDARLIIQFARTIASMDGALLCQCSAGVSRSAGAALLCLATWSGPGMEQACVQHLLAIRPCASPHHDLVAFGDTLLGREGRLLKEIGLSD